MFNRESCYLYLHRVGFIKFFCIFNMDRCYLYVCVVGFVNIFVCLTQSLIPFPFPMSAYINATFGRVLTKYMALPRYEVGQPSSTEFP